MNNIAIIGTITREIELKYLPSGVAICKFGIAFNEKIKQNEQWVDKAHFFDVTAWGKTAENINQFFRKGKQIGISGSLQFEQWQDQEGQKRSKVSIKLKEFDFIGSKNDTQQDGQNNYNPPQQVGQNNYNQPQQNYSQQQYNPPVQYSQPSNAPTHQQGINQQQSMQDQVPVIDIDLDEIPHSN